MRAPPRVEAAPSPEFLPQSLSSSPAPRLFFCCTFRMASVCLVCSCRITAESVHVSSPTAGASNKLPLVKLLALAFLWTTSCWWLSHNFGSMSLRDCQAFLLLHSCCHLPLSSLVLFSVARSSFSSFFHFNQASFLLSMDLLSSL